MPAERGGGPIDEFQAERGITARYQNIHGGRFLDAYHTKDLMKVLICLGCDPKQVFITKAGFFQLEFPLL